MKIATFRLLPVLGRSQTTCLRYGRRCVFLKLCPGEYSSVVLTGGNLITVVTVNFNESGLKKSSG